MRGFSRMHLRCGLVVIALQGCACGGRTKAADGSAGTSPEEGTSADASPPAAQPPPSCADGGTAFPTAARTRRAAARAWQSLAGPTTGRTSPRMPERRTPLIRQPSVISVSTSTDVTIGRFRQFMSAWDGGAGWVPPPGSIGKQAHLNGGRGAGRRGRPGRRKHCLRTRLDRLGRRQRCADDSEPFLLGPVAIDARWPRDDGGALRELVRGVRLLHLGRRVSADRSRMGVRRRRRQPAAPVPVGDDGSGEREPVRDLQLLLLRWRRGELLWGRPGAGRDGVALGAGRWGQLDLEGNVFQWNLDSYAPATPLPCVDCADLSTTSTGRVIRGAYYFLSGGSNCQYPLAEGTATRRCATYATRLPVCEESLKDFRELVSAGIGAHGRLWPEVCHRRAGLGEPRGNRALSPSTPSGATLSLDESARSPCPVGAAAWLLPAVARSSRRQSGDGIPSSEVSTTSVARPRIVRVTGAAMTSPSWSITASRVSSRTGRRLSGGRNVYHRISPPLHLRTRPSLPRPTPRASSASENSPARHRGARVALGVVPPDDNDLNDLALGRRQRPSP